MCVLPLTFKSTRRRRLQVVELYNGMVAPGEKRYDKWKAKFEDTKEFKIFLPAKHLLFYESFGYDFIGDVPYIQCF